MRYFWKMVFLCLIFLSNNAYPSIYPNFFTLGPEFYHLKRTREGGAEQTGWVTGGRISFDRIKRYKVYLGGDFLYASGTLHGKTASGKPLLSQVTDENIEVRIGYTLKEDRGRAYFISLFGGYGFFKEINDFYDPTPLPCRFTDSFHYLAVGFLSGVNIAPLLSMGINFKLRFMQDGTSKVSQDPLYDNVTLHMRDEIHARVDLPLFFSPCPNSRGACFLISPFFEYRHFGGRESLPFNFRDTQFYLYGTRFGFTCRF